MNEKLNGIHRIAMLDIITQFGRDEYSQIKSDPDYQLVSPPYFYPQKNGKAYCRIEYIGYSGK